jgi:rod shape-determining protein MreD
MKRILGIALFVGMAFAAQLALFNIFDRFFIPPLLLLVVIFFDFYFGIRYALVTALLAGMVKDSYATGLWGGEMLTLLLCAFLTTILRTYIYVKGSTLSRLLVITLVVVFYNVIHHVLLIYAGFMDWGGMVRFVLLPELASSLVASVFVFNLLKSCASKLFA